MRIKKVLLAGFLPCLLTSFLLSQAVTDQAQKEKDRRESLKGKKGVVVTNADLAKVKRKAAYAATGTEGKTQGQAAGSASSTASVSSATGSTQTQALPMGVGDQQNRSPQTAAQLVNEQTKTQLEGQYKKAKELRELLELKMSALQQQFYSMSDTKSKELVQQEISETYDKLTQALEAENKAREALEKFLGQSLKEKIPEIWIK